MKYVAFPPVAWSRSHKVEKHSDHSVALSLRSASASSSWAMCLLFTDTESDNYEDMLQRGICT